SSLTENLIESELFGLAKGFTPGEKGNIGLFERCSEGLLFLDEVTNLTLQAQAKILRSIENKEIQVVGGALKTVNTRLIFASNAEMRTLASSPKFRQDLYYRIEGNIVELPPLRERNNDILLLMSHFFTNYANRYSFSDQLDLRELKNDLLEYHWPGNVRELKNFCKHIILNEKEITNRNVLKHLRTKMQNRPEYSVKGMDRYLSIRNIKDSTAAFERDYILYYLQENNWHVSKTAKEMGIERTTLYKKMKALGIAQNQGEA
ncbi:MAG TPA: sigma 54-interacting transcriptional regulator, partial [Candidatus Cloacimonadota bacterium]|nr:sigma 54-interacting transcriptional regulator [Candidatus Cloacimonadota bacterium]